MLLVLLSHGRHFLVPVAGWAEDLRFGGFLGVELFFVLSGFLIGTIILDGVARAASPWRWLPGFWARRWLRTLPNYYLFLLVNAALLFAGVTRAEPWSWLPYLFFVQNLAWPHPPFFAEAWSLAVEEVFYLLAPLLVALAVAALGAGRRAVLAALLVVFAASLAARAGAVLWLDPAWDEGVRKVSLFRLDGIMLGFLFAWIHDGAGRRAEAGAVRVVAWTCAPLLVLAVPLSLLPAAWLDASVFARVALFPMTSLGCVGLLALGLAWRPPAALERVGAALARWSYSAYLANLPVFFLLLHLLGPAPAGDAAGAALRWLLFVAATLGIAAFVYRAVERPVLGLRDRAFPDGKLLLH